MGAWNTGLFYNDTTCDVRDTYIEFLKQQLSDDEAYEKTYSEYEELMGTDEEPLFWYALAETQWKTGRLTDEVKNCALLFIRKKGGSSLWEENPDYETRWQNTLQKLEEKINSPMPPKKKYRKPIEYIHNPWNVGDIYAYQFHTNKAKAKGLYGKYILLQKVADVEYYNKEVLSHIQVYDRVFESLPTLDAVKGVRILPLIIYDDFSSSTTSDASPIETFLTATMLFNKRSDYPQKHLTFIGNMALPEKSYEHTPQSDYFWDKNMEDDWLIDYYLSWQNVDY